MESLRVGCRLAQSFRDRDSEIENHHTSSYLKFPEQEESNSNEKDKANLVLESLSGDTFARKLQQEEF